jgi:hypothetical protein
MKKRKSITTILTLVIGITFIYSSCKEVTEPILDNKQIVISAPLDNLVTTTTKNTFVWEPVDGATKYQLQIVSPKFDSVLLFLTDSTFNKPMLTYTLTPGKYQWRVRAINGSSHTSYFLRSITIQ